MTATVAQLVARPGASYAAAPRAVDFVPELAITKREAFEGCDALACAGRLLEEAGRPEAAARLDALFDLIESRLTGA